MRSVRQFVAVALVLALVSGACGGPSASGGGGSAVDARLVAAAEGLVVRSLTGTVEVEISGVVSASYRGPAPYQLTTQVGEDIPESAWLLLVGLLDPITTDSGWKVRPAIDLVGYSGDGRYTIKPRGGGDVEPLERDADGNPLAGQIGSALESAAIVVLAGNGHELRSYGDLLDPCSLSVADHGERGELVCPRVTGPGGEMAVRWTWDTTGVLTQLEEDASGAPTEVEPDPVAGSDQGSGSDGPADPGPEPLGPMDVSAAMSSACWQRGVETVVTITTEPHAALAMLIAYADARTYDQQRLGTADAQGRFVWRVIPATDAPDGAGRLLVSAASPDGKRGAAADAPFELKLLCG